MRAVRSVLVALALLVPAAAWAQPTPNGRGQLVEPVDSGGRDICGAANPCNVQPAPGSVGSSTSTPSYTASAPFARSALDSTAIQAVGTYQAVSSALDAPHELCVTNTTPYGTAAPLYVDPTGATGSGGTVAPTSRLLAPPQSAATPGDMLCLPAPGNAVTIMSTSAGATFRGWKG